MKDKFFTKWILDFFSKKEISVKLKNKWITLKYYNDNTIQIVNTRNNDHGTLSIDTLKRLFLTYKGDDKVDYKKTSGLYTYYLYTIKSMHMELETKEEKSINKDTIFKDAMNKYTELELISLLKENGIDIKAKMIEMLVN